MIGTLKKKVAVTVSLCMVSSCFAVSSMPVRGASEDTGINPAIYSEANYRNEFAEDRVIVAYKDGKTGVQSIANAANLETKPVRKFSIKKNQSGAAADSANNKKNIAVMKLKNKGKNEVLNTIKKLKNDPNVAYVEPDYKIEFCATPNDPKFSEMTGQYRTMYNMEKITASKAWDRTTGSASVVVGVLDTGIDYNHPDLKDNMWKNPGEIAGNGVDDDQNGYIDDIYGWDFGKYDNDPMDASKPNGHGTLCAGIIGAEGNNGIGVAGVAWNVKIASLKLSEGASYASNAVLALQYAEEKGIRIASNSWITYGFNQALYDAIKGYDGLFVAAAGNFYEDIDVSPIYPASFDLPNIITVAGTDQNDELFYYGKLSGSSWGVNSVDLAAPGKDIMSTLPYYNENTPIYGPYAHMSGTSMAVPHVAGAAALLLSTWPSMSISSLKAHLLKSVDQCPALYGKVATGGRLNLYKLMQYDYGVRYEWDNPNMGESSFALAWLTGDVDGDGRGDVIQPFNNNGALSTRVYFSKPASATSAPGYTAKTRMDCLVSSQAITWLTGDMNGDKKTDMIRVWSNNGRLGLSTFQSNGTNLPLTWEKNDMGQGCGSLKWLTGDVNGDGKTDIVQPWNNNGKLGMVIYLSTGSTYECAPGGTSDIGTSSSAIGYHMADVNGDGKSDVIRVFNNNGKLGITTYASNGSAFSILSNQPDLGYNAAAMDIQAGDVNGDGKADIVQVWNNNGKLAINTFKWNGVGYTCSDSKTTLQGSEGIKWMWGDFTGDKRMDFVQLWDNVGKLGMLVFASNGNGFYGKSGTSDMGQVPYANDWVTTDYNADGKTDIIQLMHNRGTNSLQIISYIGQ